MVDNEFSNLEMLVFQEGVAPPTLWFVARGTASRAVPRGPAASGSVALLSRSVRRRRAPFRCGCPPIAPPGATRQARRSRTRAPAVQGYQPGLRASVR